MVIDKIKYTKEFQYHGISEWIGVEAGVEPLEDTQESLLALRRILVKTFHAALAEGGEGLPVIEGKEQIDLSGDAEFEALKAKLTEFEYQEDAAAYLETTEFKYTVAAKQLVNQKPKKQ